MKSYPVKENPICSAVSEILRYKQTKRQTDIVLLCIIDDENELKLQNIYTRSLVKYISLNYAQEGVENISHIGIG